MNNESNLVCPRWSKCSVPICPLERNKLDRKMLAEDPVCVYLSEAVKRGAEARFRERGLGDLYEVVVGAIPGLADRWSRIRRALLRAMNSGSRWDALRRNRGDHE